MSAFLATKEGLGMFPTAALLVFFISFLLILKFTWNMSQDDLNHCQNLPLESNAKERP